MNFLRFVGLRTILAQRQSYSPGMRDMTALPRLLPRL